jgi:hypothetical protein
MEKVDVSSHQVACGEGFEVTTMLHTGDAPIKGSLTVLFYDAPHNRSSC